MSARRMVATLLVLSMFMMSGAGLVRAVDAQPAVPPAPGGAPAPVQSTEATPARVGYINGEVSFWRPGAQDWAPAKLNTPLAPGDVLYTGQGGNVEIQVAPRAFVRAAEDTQIGLDNQEPDFVQFRVTAGHAALDLRELAPGATVELDTPNGAFTIERAGYYHVDVDQDSTTFSTHRGGGATMTPAGGAAAPIAANQQVVVTGTESPRVAIGVAPQLSAWDRWNYQRTDSLLQPVSARYVSPTMYGTEALDQYGSWRTVDTYGAVWVPGGVPAGWLPYSTGRWIWDPRFGWTWLDDTPWGWAPYHYGRWVFVGSYWAWAPGPIVVRPAYAPALVVFLGGPVTVSVGARPLFWAPLGWGEPLIPWWGRPGFVGVASWGGWGGPRVVNNVVINRTTTVNVTNITVYKNVHVTNAVVGVPADRFGHGHVQVTRVNRGEVRHLTPVRGALEARPVAASVVPATGPAARPPAALHTRTVVATRPPHDVTPTLQAHGLPATPTLAPAGAPRIVAPPKRVLAPASPTVVPEPAPGKAPNATPGAAGPVPSPRGPEQRKGNVPEQPATPPPGSPGVATPEQPGQPGPEQRRGTAPKRPAPSSPPGSPGVATPQPPSPPSPEQRRGTAPERPAPPPPGSPGVVTPQPPSPPSPEQRRGTATERPALPSAPGSPGVATPQQPGPPSPEQRRGTAPERPAPPPPGSPGVITPQQPSPPSPEQRRGAAPERPAPPPPGSPGVVTPQQPSPPSPEQRRGIAPERSAPPPSGSPGLVTPQRPGPPSPEQRRGTAPERPAPPPPGSPGVATPQQPGPPSPEQRRGIAPERSAPPPSGSPGLVTPQRPGPPSPEQRRGNAPERSVPPSPPSSPGALTPQVPGASARPEQRANQATPPQAPPQRPARVGPPPAQPEQSEPPPAVRNERPERSERR